MEQAPNQQLEIIYFDNTTDQIRDVIDEFVSSASGLSIDTIQRAMSAARDPHSKIAEDIRGQEDDGLKRVVLAWEAVIKSNAVLEVAGFNDAIENQIDTYLLDNPPEQKVDNIIQNRMSQSDSEAARERYREHLMEIRFAIFASQQVPEKISGTSKGEQEEQEEQ